LPLKEGAKVEIIVGKHAGEKGELVGFEELTRGRTYVIKLEDKTVSLPYKTILVIA
jgi:ribosomal protein S4E